MAPWRVIAISLVYIISVSRCATASLLPSKPHCNVACLQHARLENPGTCWTWTKNRGEACWFGETNLQKTAASQPSSHVFVHVWYSVAHILPISASHLSLVGVSTPSCRNPHGLMQSGVSKEVLQANIMSNLRAPPQWLPPPQEIRPY